MAKNLFRIFNTKEEYDNIKCSLHKDTLSIIIENDNVIYGIKPSHFTATYNVTSTNSSTKLLGFSSSDMQQISKMYIDDIEVTPTSAYTFTTLGEHIVKCTFDCGKLTNCYTMFYNCNKLTSLDLSSFDTSNVTDMRNMFKNCSGLTSLDLSGWDTSKVTSMNEIFYYCNKLQRIDGYLDWSKISSYPSNFITSTSSYGYPLRYMTIKNLGKTGTTLNFNNNNIQNWGDESDTTTYPLSVGARQSLVDSLLTYSYDRAANGLSNCTIQLHSSVKARLTADEITAIQNKGYTIS
jgi:surface protein